jgi:hypothetical protein
MGVILMVCGLVALIAGIGRSYTAARQAVWPFIRDGEPTRSATEATRPLVARPRVRLFARRVATSVGWLAVAMYGLYLMTIGSWVAA